MSEYRTGIGWDVHRIGPNRPFLLGGVSIPAAFGLEGHSDADVLSHAITDAVLGAAALGDIRLMFMQSKGGLTSARLFRGKDAILSGPAGGIVGAVRVSRAAGFARIITFDMEVKDFVVRPGT